jgi:shikimate kinase
MMTAEAEASESMQTTQRRSVRPGIQRIVLTGFMGSGKSTVGALVAERLGWNFRDLDAEIERRCGLAVPEIFAQMGEAHFRHQETAALASVLGGERTVIALGGGALEELGNRLLLEQTRETAIVFLEAPFATLYDRCVAQAGGTVRPVLADREIAAVRFEARQRGYRRTAHVRVDAAAQSAEEAAEAVLRVLG